MPPAHALQDNFPLHELVRHTPASPALDHVASTRKPERAAQLGALGASEVLPEAADLSRALRRHWPAGIDAVLDIVGNNTLLDSLHAVRFNGKVCQAGFLGGMEPVKDFNPLAHLPSGVQLSFFASFMFGQPDFSLADIPLQTIVRHTEAGHYQAKPARVFRFEEMPAAHRLIESDGANGKVVV